MQNFKRQTGPVFVKIKVKMDNSRKDRIQSADAKAILDAAKPNIFEGSPRRGGYVPQAYNYGAQQVQSVGNNTTSSLSQSKFEENIKAESTIKKGCPCRSIMEQESAFMESFAYGIPDLSPSCQQQQQQGPPLESLYKKSNFSTAANSAMDTSSNETSSLLAVAISTVMLMASEYPRIPDEYLEYTKNYLDCIKDGNEQHPPNIEGILKHIKYLRENGLVRPIGEESKIDVVEDRGAEGIEPTAEEENPEEPPAPGRSPRFNKNYRKYQNRLVKSYLTLIPSNLKKK